MLLTRNPNPPFIVNPVLKVGLESSSFEELWKLMFHTFPAEHKPPMVIELYGDIEPGNTDTVVNGGVSIQLAVAGFQPEDIQVYTKDSILYIEGDNRQRSNVPDKFKSKFQKQLPSKKNIDLSKADVELSYGILTIKIPFICPEENKTYLFGKKQLSEVKENGKEEK